jgi:hypothetical protein
MEGWLVNNKLEKMWKKVDVASFYELSYNLPGRTKEYHEKP